VGDAHRAPTADGQLGFRGAGDLSNKLTGPLGVAPGGDPSPQAPCGANLLPRSSTKFVTAGRAATRARLGIEDEGQVEGSSAGQVPRQDIDASRTGRQGCSTPWTQRREAHR